MFLRKVLLACLSVLFLTTCHLPAQESSISNKDWPCWRGPNHNGIAYSRQTPPTQWSETENVLWKVPIAGRGHGSAIVLGENVFITSADAEQELQTVVCIDRKSGTVNWEAKVHEGGLKTKGNKKQNKKASLASTTPATDGKHLFVNFLNHEAVWTTALDLKGNILWQKKVSDYVVHQGYGSSPFLYKDLVLVSADNKGGGAIAGLKKSNGEIVWKRERPKKPNYPSPVVFSVDGRDQLFMTGCDLVTSLNPATGEELWEIEGATTECVSTTVTDGQHIFTSGGYPENHIAAVKADGSGKIAWKNNTREYVPSMICHEGYLYAVLDAGVAVCYESSTGDVKWKGRMNGNFTSSPIKVGDLIYATSESGKTYIFKAQPTKLEVVGTNQLGDNVLSTASICDSRIFIRVAHFEGEKRQEYLYCLGSE